MVFIHTFHLRKNKHLNAHEQKNKLTQTFSLLLLNLLYFQHFMLVVTHGLCLDSTVALCQLQSCIEDLNPIFSHSFVLTEFRVIIRNFHLHISLQLVTRNTVQSFHNWTCDTHIRCTKPKNIYKVIK